MPEIIMQQPSLVQETSQQLVDPHISIHNLFLVTINALTGLLIYKLPDLWK